MLILNLVNKDTSDVKFEVSKFPDGQQQIRLIPPYEFWVPGSPILIKSRLNSFLDLELIICSVASLRGIGVDKIHLNVPYFEGSRSDRKFEEGSNNYLKDVICPIINSLKLDSVTVLDPHSDCLEMGLNNFVKESNKKVVAMAFAYLKESMERYDDFLKRIVLISPDAGASKKIFKLAELFNYKGDVITCSKDRDTEGKLTKTIVPGFNTDHNNMDLIIIDDICDGGATFINIAKVIRKGAFKGKLHLIVTHGIFSKGFQELKQYFDHVYCSNSYRTIGDDEIIPEIGSSAKVKNLVKQLNVF